MSAVTASILVGTKHRVDLGIQPRWIVLLHEANGYAWHLLRLQLSSGDISPPPKIGLLERQAPGTRAGLDQPPGILWRAGAGGDLVGELALMLHLHAARTPEVLAAVRRLDPLAARRVDLGGLDGRESGDLANAVRIARTTGGGLYLAATIIAGSRLTEEALLELPEWEITIAATVLSRDWIRADGGHLEVTDFRQAPEPLPPDEDFAEPEPTPWPAVPAATEASATVAGPTLGGHAGDAPDAPVAATYPRGGPPPVTEDAPPVGDAELAQARRYGVRRLATAGRARIQRLERERQAADAAREASGGVNRADAGPNWLDDFLHD